VSAGCRAAICLLPSPRPPGGDLRTPLARCPLPWVSSPLAATPGVSLPLAQGPGQADFGVSGLTSRVSPTASPMLSWPESVGASLFQENLPKKAERLLDKLSQVLTEGFAAGPLALSVAVERVGAGGLFEGRAAEEGEAPSHGAAVMLQPSRAWGQPSGTHSDGSQSSVGTRATQNRDRTCLWGGQKPPNPIAILAGDGSRPLSPLQG